MPHHIWGKAPLRLGISRVRDNESKNQRRTSSNDHRRILAGNWGNAAAKDEDNNPAPTRRPCRDRYVQTPLIGLFCKSPGRSETSALEHQV
eukprot:scaffold184_cov316-Pinguiococcus_pyrenoidosus.AAC.8